MSALRFTSFLRQKQNSGQDISQAHKQAQTQEIFNLVCGGVFTYLESIN